jgi:HAMP domain-containing protein
VDALFTALAALGAAASAWAAFLTLRDQQVGRRLADRGDYYRKVVAEPSIDEIRSFVKAVRQMLESERAAVSSASPELLPGRDIEVQRRVARAYSVRVLELRTALLDAASAWADRSFVTRLEFQVDRIDDLAEQIPQLLNASAVDPRLVAQMSQVAAVLTNLVISHDWASDPRAEKRHTRAAFFGNG